jgi:single-stranded-DNA-specific exonuclease
MNKFQQKGKILEPVARILAARGYTNLEKMESFLFPSPDDMHDPILLDEMDKAVDRLLKAMDGDERILVWGDEDTDGMTATIVLFKILKDLGASVSFHIPKRSTEGIGISKDGVDNAIKDGIKLICTVDCGSSNADTVDYARERGIDVIITDHHEVAKREPDAIAFLNPKKENSNYPFRFLAGSGVAYKLVEGLASRRLEITYRQFFDVRKDLLLLVMLGTIGDRVPLVDENRVFVRFGLKSLEGRKDSWLQAIKRVTGRDMDRNTTSREIMKGVTPIFSATRMMDDNPVPELLLTDSVERAENIVGRLLNSNRIWQEEMDSAYIRCKRQVSQSKDLILIIDRDLPHYLLGSCASRLEDETGRPCIIVGYKPSHNEIVRGKSEEIAVGEARAPEGFDLVALFKEMEELFIDYGGHKPAAGFTIRVKELDSLKKLSVALARKQMSKTKKKTELNIDAEIIASELTPDFLEQLKWLAPFGQGNKKPLLITRGIKSKRIMGMAHLTGNLPPEDKEVDIIYTIDEQSNIEIVEWR